jgi:hypothetical protein
MFRCRCEWRKGSEENEEREGRDAKRRGEDAE